MFGKLSQRFDRCLENIDYNIERDRFLANIDYNINGIDV